MRAEEEPREDAGCPAWGPGTTMDRTRTGAPRRGGWSGIRRRAAAPPCRPPVPAHGSGGLHVHVLGAGSSLHPSTSVVWNEAGQGEGANLPWCAPGACSGRANRSADTTTPSPPSHPTPARPGDQSAATTTRLRVADCRSGRTFVHLHRPCSVGRDGRGRSGARGRSLVDRAKPCRAMSMRATPRPAEESGERRRAGIRSRSVSLLADGGRVGEGQHGGIRRRLISLPTAGIDSPPVASRRPRRQGWCRAPEPRKLVAIHTHRGSIRLPRGALPRG